MKLYFSRNLQTEKLNLWTDLIVTHCMHNPCPERRILLNSFITWQLTSFPNHLRLLPGIPGHFSAAICNLQVLTDSNCSKLHVALEGEKNHKSLSMSNSLHLFQKQNNNVQWQESTGTFVSLSLQHPMKTHAIAFCLYSYTQGLLHKWGKQHWSPNMFSLTYFHIQEILVTFLINPDTTVDVTWRGGASCDVSSWLRTFVHFSSAMWEYQRLFPPPFTNQLLAFTFHNCQVGWVKYKAKYKPRWAEACKKELVNGSWAPPKVDHCFLSRTI